jgi:hypothetical protein
VVVSAAIVEIPVAVLGEIATSNYAGVGGAGNRLIESPWMEYPVVVCLGVGVVDLGTFLEFANAL